MNLRETFQSPYEQYKEHIGKSFSLNGLTKNETDPEVGELYSITLSTGETIDAWPEEIFSDTGWNPNSKTE